MVGNPPFISNLDYAVFLEREHFKSSDDPPSSRGFRSKGWMTIPKNQGVLIAWAGFFSPDGHQFDPVVTPIIYCT